MKSRSLELWKQMGATRYISIVGVMIFGQSFFTVSLLIDSYFGTEIISNNLYIKLSASLIIGLVWGFIIWNLFIGKPRQLEESSLRN